MNKQVAILLVTCSTCLFSQAQYQKGDSKFSLSIPSYSVRSPNFQFGYERFLTDRLSLGVDGSYSRFSTPTFGTSHRITVSPFAKYYIKNAGIFRPFIFARTQLSHLQYSPGKTGAYASFRSTQINASTGLGLSIHATERWSFEARLGYGVSYGSGNFHRGLTGSIGISYTLPHKSRRKK